jgi:iron complex outermembrane receptor protein
MPRIYSLAPALFALGIAHAEDLHTLEPVKVEAVRVVPGTEVPIQRIPSNLQTIDGRTLLEPQSLNLPDLLLKQLPSVNVNEVQGNPFQLQLNYRGFTAGPLLGSAQGLSVYVDGVRVNEAFGNVVNWDLIPGANIDSIALMPGANPLYGLNTLGGALVVHTKRGDTHPGTEALLSGGSFGRRSIGLAHGEQFGAAHAFVAIGGLEEDGWRDYSRSRLRNAFGKFGAHDSKLDWDIALTHARNDLVGNGLVPLSMVDARREQIYTRPDATKNEMNMAAFNATYSISERQRLAAVIYERRTNTSTLNGDVNNEFQTAPDSSGVQNRTHTSQRGHGISLQWSLLQEQSEVTVGAAHDRSSSRFTQTAARGELDATRAVIPTGPIATNAQLAGATRTVGLYLTATYALAQDVRLTFGARHNTTRVLTTDELNPPGSSDLNADYTYRKLNPMIGLTWQTRPGLTVFGSLSQGNRVPTPIELGCANPARPCTLPNGLQSDPFLKQVVARTVEVGARGSSAGDQRWSAALFRTVNTDDIIFVGTSATASRGFFQNFGRTRRQGLELALAGKANAVDWQLGYSYVKATFESAACIVAASNSSAGAAPACAAEQIEVTPGNSIPGIPQHTLKLNVMAQPSANWKIGADATAFSTQFARGNENNAHQGDGARFYGSGKLAGFALLDIFGSYTLGGSWELFAKISNVFDRTYETAGQLGRNSFDAQGHFINDASLWRNEQFVGPGAPRAAWIGIRYHSRAR